MEVAIQMTRFSLRRFGVSSAEVDAIASGLREHGGGDDGPEEPGGPAGRGLRATAARVRSRLAGRPADRGRAVEAGAPTGETEPESTIPSGRVSAEPRLPAGDATRRTVGEAARLAATED